MSGRVLNFSEFFDKYSSGTGAEVSLDDMTQSSSNFEVGFDDATYDQAQIGPNRPVASGASPTPPAPGEGTPISTKKDSEMEAPAEEDLTDIEPEESAETPEPEANESRMVVGFNQFVNEASFYEYGEDPYAESDDHSHSEEDPYAEEYDDSMCKNCGEEIWYSEQGASCGCNM